MNLKLNHVSYLWDDAKAATMAGDEVALFIYRSNLLGADLRLTNYGGGNRSHVDKRLWRRPRNAHARRLRGTLP
jgi:hypothetical protein